MTTKKAVEIDEKTNNKQEAKQHRQKTANKSIPNGDKKEAKRRQ